MRKQSEIINTDLPKQFTSDIDIQSDIQSSMNVVTDVKSNNASNIADGQLIIDKTTGLTYTNISGKLHKQVIENNVIKYKEV